MQKTETSDRRGSATAAVLVLVENARGAEAAETAEKNQNRNGLMLWGPRHKPRASGGLTSCLREECWLWQEKQALAGLESCNPGRKRGCTVTSVLIWPTEPSVAVTPRFPIPIAVTPRPHFV